MILFVLVWTPGCPIPPVLSDDLQLITTDDTDEPILILQNSNSNSNDIEVAIYTPFHSLDNYKPRIPINALSYFPSYIRTLQPETQLIDEHDDLTRSFIPPSSSPSSSSSSSSSARSNSYFSSSNRPTYIPLNTFSIHTPATSSSPPHTPPSAAYSRLKDQSTLNPNEL
jgi:hypothetical protein